MSDNQQSVHYDMNITRRVTITCPHADCRTRQEATMEKRDGRWIPHFCAKCKRSTAAPPR